MKKKITALGLMLVAMLCMSVANAQYTYKWEVLTGTDADGGEVWTEVTDPLGTGITVQSLTKMRLTVDGAYMVKDLYSGYKYLYNSDFETKAISNSVSTKAADNVLTWDASAAYYTPDKPFTKEGTYYFVVPENGFYIYATQADYEASPKVSTKNPDKHILKVTVDNDYFIQQADCAIDVTSPVFMSFPSQFVVTLNNDNITKTALSENANIGIYSSSTLKSEFDVAISDDGKTLTLTPKTVLSSGQGLYVSILAGSLTFNDDATKTNNHLMFGPYAFPSSSSFRGTYPEAGGKTTSLDKIYAYVGSSSGTYFFDDTKSIVLKKYNAETQAYDAVCNLTPKQVDGPTSPAAQNYITLEFTPAETPAEGLTPGAYQVEIPEKAIFYEKSSGSSTYYYYLKAATYDYELAEVPNVTLTPVWSIEEGSTQKDLETLTATFAGATTARFNYMAMPQIYKKIGSSYTYVADVTLSGLSSSEFNAIGEGGVVTLTFDKLSQEGEYKIDFPAGALAFEGFADLVNEASEVSFNIESNAPIKPSNVTIDPKAGGIADFPAQFTLTIDNADITAVEVGAEEVWVGWDEDYNDIYELQTFTASLVEVGGYNSVQYDIAVDADDCKKIILTKSADNYATFDPTQKYYLEVKAGSLIVNKNAETGESLINDDLAFGMYVAMALEVTPDPEEVIYSAKDFYIKSNTESLTFANDESKPVMINYEDPEFGMISPINVTVTAVEGTTNEFLISTGMDAKQPGTYTLVIPAGSFFYNGDENQPVAESTFVYTLEVEPIDEGVTTIPAQGDLDINRVGGTFRAVNVIFPEDVMVNPDFKGEITLAIDGTQVSSINKLSSGELATELGIVFPDKFTQNGTYTVTMPRGAALYRADGRETSSQVFTWNVTGGFEKADGVTVDPAEGEVESISLVTMVFNEYEVATKNIFYNTSALAKNGNVVLRNAAGEIVASATTSEMAPSTVGYNAVEVQFCKPGTIEAIEITAPGTYTMTLPEGIINYNASGANPCECGECNACTTSRKGTGNGNYNEEMTFTWTILGDATLVATPADGETVDQLVNIILEWQGASAVTVDATLMVGGAKLYKVVEGGENEFVSDMICSPIGEGSNTAVLDIFNMPTEKGAYVVEIAEGMFTVDGTAWEAVTLNYTLGGVDVVLTDKGDAPLRKFEMTVTPCETIEVNPESSGVITLAYLESGITEVGSYTLENINGNTADLTLSTDNELADGNYVVWIPEGHLIFDGKPCADIKVYFDNVVMNGIYGISIDAKDLNIYSVNGMLIKRNGSISDLNELEPGVYIINGKKVLVK